MSALNGRERPSGKKHILITSAWFPSTDNTNGIFVKEQAEALARRGHSVTVLIPDHDNLRTLLGRKGSERPRYLESELITILRPRIIFPVPSRFLSDPDAAYRRYIEKKAVRAVQSYVSTRGPIDVVHHHCLSDNSYIAGTLAAEFKVPYVFTEYSNYWCYEQLNRFNTFESREEHVAFVRSAAARIAAAEVRASGYERIFGVPFICIPNLVSKTFETPLLPRKAEVPFRFICVAVLDDRKRQDLLLRAFASEFKGAAVCLTLVGNGRREQSYRELAKELGIANQAEFAGICPREKVKALFDNAHAGVLASDQETFAIVLAEAMFRGIPVISTRSGGPEEVVGPDTGFLVPVGDEKAFAQSMRGLYDNYQSYDPMRIRDWAMSRFSEDVVTVRLEAMYDGVCSAAPASRDLQPR